jgi:membrane-associated protease RseP (regulator of RpoE activity)
MAFNQSPFSSVMPRLTRCILHTRQWAIMGIILAFLFIHLPTPEARPLNGVMTKEYAIQLGEEFGIVVGEVDEEIREFLGLERAEGVVVFEVIGGKPAALAGIKPRALIKEINSVEVSTLEDFGHALQMALPTENFSIATYEPADPDDQGVSGGINFHFVRIEKS